MGETRHHRRESNRVGGTFSILERIDVGETVQSCRRVFRPEPFSILERIDVGETSAFGDVDQGPLLNFQYPRTDRRG